jgi:signal recognition particle GTPase
MLDKMLPSELENYKLIDLAAKERISRASGKTVEEVSRLLTGYCQSLVMQQWLLMKSVIRLASCLFKMFDCYVFNPEKLPVKHYR